MRYLFPDSLPSIAFYSATFNILKRIFLNENVRIFTEICY